MNIGAVELPFHINILPISLHCPIKIVILYKKKTFLLRSRHRERRSGSLDRRRAKSAERLDRQHRSDRDRKKRDEWRRWRERQRDRLEGRKCFISCI